MVDHRWLNGSARSVTTDIGAVRGELFGLPGPIDPDHVAESARSAGGDPGQGVFEHRGAAGLNPEGVRRGEEHVRCRFARQVLPLRGQTVDALLE